MAELPGVTTSTPSGRKNGDGVHETISTKPIKDAAKELMKLYKKAELAKNDFNSAITKVAEKAKCNSSTLKKLVTSSAKSKFEDARRDIEQASIIFESVGEIAGGSVTNPEA